MAVPSSTPSLVLLLLMVVLFAILSPASSSVPEGIRAHMTRVDAAGNFTKLEFIERSLKRGQQRMARLIGRIKLDAAPSGATDLQTPVHSGQGEFIMDLALGSPSVPFPAIVDTGSDLIWTQCKPCQECYTQPTPIFDPSSSSTFKKLPCSGDLCQALPSSDCEESECRYSYSYGDSSNTQGILSSDKLSFGDVSVPGIGFGCGEENSGGGFEQAAGLVGLGRGPLSLISQLGLGKFSYCLTSLDESKKSPLLFGSLAKIDGTGAQTTPLIQNSNQPSFYYLNLKGISVGGTLLSIPKSTFSLNDDGTGGLIIDSGTSITYLEEKGYKELKKAFTSQVQLSVADGSDIGLDLCFLTDSSSSDVKIPKLVFHFIGADLDLQPENYMVLDEGTGLLCLTVAGSNGISIFGNFQQQNLQVLYDLKNEKLSFAPVKCDQL